MSTGCGEGGGRWGGAGCAQSLVPPTPGVWLRPHLWRGGYTPHGCTGTLSEGPEVTDMQSPSSLACSPEFSQSSQLSVLARPELCTHLGRPLSARRPAWMLQGCGLGAWGWKAMTPPGIVWEVPSFCSADPGTLWPEGWAGGRAQNQVSPSHGRGPGFIWSSCSDLGRQLAGEPPPLGSPPAWLPSWGLGVHMALSLPSGLA